MKATILSVLGTIAVGVVAQELEIEVTYAVECTNKTQKGDFISVNYNGTFTNGTTFDSSYDEEGSDPFGFTLGAGDVIKGWDMGLLDMCVGDKRKLTVPPEFGYGNRTVGPIPPNSTLVFYTELMGIGQGYKL